ncbi:hypothetical protein KY290_024106 [Solanum tuberosum]|uniref:FBD domain-containing protein n=1 Tax=Solanum tuberosum TaxID=4113 RepID=A0ABQ7UPU9_SOLTU|nr:hypothetical protein KY290_024106 [Solanum tuberosum]
MNGRVDSERIGNRKGVTDLTLRNQPNALYKLPSCMYDIELEESRQNDSYYIKCFATEAERLPAYLNSLNAITIFEFDFDDEDQIFSLLRLLRVSPNLDFLHLVLSSKKKKTDDMEVNVVNHFEGPAYRTLGVLHRLQRLIIKNFHVYIRVCTLLLKTVIHEDAESVDESQSLKISELLGFPRASPKLKMHVNRRSNTSILASGSSQVGG